MINILVLLLILAIGSPNSTVIRDNYGQYCDYADTCNKGDFGASWQVGHYAPTRATLGCYPSANINLYTLELLPNDSVIVSCLNKYDDRIVYTVSYESNLAASGYDVWGLGIDTMTLYLDGRVTQSTRVITVPDMR